VERKKRCNRGNIVAQGAFFSPWWREKKEVTQLHKVHFSLPGGEKKR